MDQAGQLGRQFGPTAGLLDLEGQKHGRGAASLEDGGELLDDLKDGHPTELGAGLRGVGSVGLVEGARGSGEEHGEGVDHPRVRGDARHVDIRQSVLPCQERAGGRAAATTGGTVGLADLP